MCRRWVLIALASAGALHAQVVGRHTQSLVDVPSSGDSLSALRARYAAEISALLPTWKSAERDALVADSVNASRLPPDSLRAGAMLWLLDDSPRSSVQEAVTRAWSELSSVFGAEANVLKNHLFIARLRPEGGRDTTKKVFDLAEVYPGRLDIFDRVSENEAVEPILGRITRRSAKIILESGDSAVLRWLVEPFNPIPLQKGARERMYADLVTAPSQVSSRCLAGDLRRCRDALGLVSVADPLTEWYDPGERRLLVTRMRELLNVGAQRPAYTQCDQRRAYAVCDRILRSIPHYSAPPPLPTSSRHHLFRIAMNAGGNGAYSRLVSGPARNVDSRLADAARMPIDSLVARWRADVLDAHPSSPNLSALSAWTAVAWGIAILLVGVRFATWR
jgi:hypothetical protein